MKKQDESIRIFSIICIIIMLITLFLLSGCKVKTVYIPLEKTRTVKETETIHDTVIQIKLVPYYQETITENDSSYLENDYAYSFARWDGVFLHHNLGIFDKEIPANIKYINRYVYVHDSIPVPYPVVEYKEVNKITSFQSFQIWCGRLLLLLVLGYLGFRWMKKL